MPNFMGVSPLLRLGGQRFLSYSLGMANKLVNDGESGKRSHFIERLRRSLKYVRTASVRDIYLHDYATVPALEAGLGRYFTFYNYERPHQSLDYAVPGKVHQAVIHLVH